MNEVIGFLKRNGFERMEKNSYANDKCNVTFEEYGYYGVSDNEGNTMYSTNLEIYWLIGVLTYYDYIPKNYSK